MSLKTLVTSIALIACLGFGNSFSSWRFLIINSQILLSYLVQSEVIKCHKGTVVLGIQVLEKTDCANGITMCQNKTISVGKTTQ